MGKICPQCRCHIIRSRVVGERYRFDCEHCEHVWYEQMTVPLPCPEPKGEMVVKVLTVHDNTDAWGYHITTLGACLEPHTENVRMVGIYRVPDSVLDEDKGGRLAEALKAIRDAGGKWVAGALLPEKVVETYPFVHRVQARFYPYMCSQCGHAYASSKSILCGTCGAHLKGEVPWTPYPANKEC